MRQQLQAEIFRRRDAGEPVRDIATALGVALNSIYYELYCPARSVLARDRWLIRKGLIP